MVPGVARSDGFISSSVPWKNEAGISPPGKPGVCVRCVGGVCVCV